LFILDSTIEMIRRVTQVLLLHVTLVPLAFAYFGNCDM